MQIKTSIIPSQPKEVYNNEEKNIDYKAVCIFGAIGFFLDDDTYFTNRKILKPASNHSITSGNTIEKSESYFNWHYSPRDISFNTALEEFTILFEKIIKEQIGDKKVILPLSGGIDSRTQATALKHLNANVFTYSYDYKNGYPETKIAKQVADICNFNFESYKIEQGYLWDVIDDLAKVNGCYSDFTSPRQMAIAHQFTKIGDVFSLGHWGDVLFDSYNVESLSHEQQVDFLSQKLLKRGGLEFAEILWKAWNLEGDFIDYYLSRISEALSTVNIEDTNAKLRAFKSKYWAPRWTSVNLSVFEKAKPITLPYYDDRMCEFICTIPEAYLANRQLQIAYIKKRNPELANIVWQDKRPYNLNNFTNQNTFKTFSYKVKNKLSRSIKQIFGQAYIQRNWELQFLGSDNRKQLEKAIQTANESQFIPNTIIQNYIPKFYNEDALKHAHGVNMILTLAKFNQHYNNG